MTASIGTKAIHAGLAALALALGAAPAQAALLELDLLAPQDGLITLDTRSGLEWLDLNATFGLAYDDTLATDYVTKLGFRFATPDDLLGLFAHVGVSPGESAANGPGVLKLLDLMGCTAQCYQGWRAGQGWLDMGDPTMTAWAFFQYHEMADEPGGPLVGYGDATLPPYVYVSKETRKADSSQGTGSFLIRDFERGCVPEPASWALMIAGFGLTGAALRHRRAALA